MHVYYIADSRHDHTTPIFLRFAKFHCIRERQLQQVSKDLDHSCNKYCNLIGQLEGSICDRIPTRLIDLDEVWVGYPTCKVKKNERVGQLL